MTLFRFLLVQGNECKINTFDKCLLSQFVLTSISIRLLSSTSPCFSEILQAAIRNRSGVVQEQPTDNSLESRTQRALSGISLTGLRRLLAAGGIRLTDEDDDEEEEEEMDDDDDGEAGWFGGGNRRGASSNMNDFWEPVKEPVKAGKELLESGEFGRVSKERLRTGNGFENLKS